MNLLADENFPRVVVEALRAAGHDVVWARTDMPAAADDVILGRAQAEGRLVVTFDKDFGELAFRWAFLPPAEWRFFVFTPRPRIMCWPVFLTLFATRLAGQGILRSSKTTGSVCGVCRRNGALRVAVVG